jgi:hypothetical protein
MVMEVNGGGESAASSCSHRPPVRQFGDRTSPLSAWLVRREDSYSAGPRVNWDCALIAHAAARDAARWPLNRTVKGSRQVSMMRIFFFMAGSENLPMATGSG